MPAGVTLSCLSSGADGTVQERTTASVPRKAHGALAGQAPVSSMRNPQAPATFQNLPGWQSHESGPHLNWEKGRCTMAGLQQLPVIKSCHRLCPDRGGPQGVYRRGPYFCWALRTGKARRAIQPAGPDCRHNPARGSNPRAQHHFRQPCAGTTLLFSPCSLGVRDKAGPDFQRSL